MCLLEQSYGLQKIGSKGSFVNNRFLGFTQNLGWGTKQVIKLGVIIGNKNYVWLTEFYPSTTPIFYQCYINAYKYDSNKNFFMTIGLKRLLNFKVFGSTDTYIGLSKNTHKKKIQLYRKLQVFNYKLNLKSSLNLESKGFVVYKKNLNNQVLYNNTLNKKQVNFANWVGFFDNTKTPYFQITTPNTNYYSTTLLKKHFYSL